MYHDLGIVIRQSRVDEVSKFVKFAYELNFDIVTFNQIQNKLNPIKPIDTIIFNHKYLKESIKLRNISSTSSSSTTTTTTTATTATTATTKQLKQLKQLNRLTININTIIEAQSLTSSNSILKTYDIVAASTTDIKVFTYLCTQADIDIISLDFTKNLFSIDKKTLDKAIERGIHFEIVYSSLLKNNDERKYIINNTKSIIYYLRGRHIILSSGAENFNQLRSPLDIINIGLILGLSEYNSKAAITSNCQNVIEHGQLRKFGYNQIQLKRKIDDVYINKNNNDQDKDDDDDDDEDEKDKNNSPDEADKLEFIL